MDPLEVWERKVSVEQEHLEIAKRNITAPQWGQEHNIRQGINRLVLAPQRGFSAKSSYQLGYTVARKPIVRHSPAGDIMHGAMTAPNAAILEVWVCHIDVLTPGNPTFPFATVIYPRQRHAIAQSRDSGQAFYTIQWNAILVLRYDISTDLHGLIIVLGNRTERAVDPRAATLTRESGTNRCDLPHPRTVNHPWVRNKIKQLVQR